jgi:hypothetical protein
MPRSSFDIPFSTVKRWRSQYGHGFEKSWAWWYLSRRLKEALAAGRKQGRWGGEPGKVPYFWIQEYGMAEVRIPPKLFMEGAIQELLQKQDVIIARFIHAA